MKFDEHPDWDETDYVIASIEDLVRAAPVDAVAALVELAGTLPDDRLCGLGVRIIEPLVDLHWSEIGDAFEAAARSHTSLRKALSCAWFSDSVLSLTVAVPPLAIAPPTPAKTTTFNPRRSAATLCEKVLPVTIREEASVSIAPPTPSLPAPPSSPALPTTRLPVKVQLVTVKPP